MFEDYGISQSDVLIHDYFKDLERNPAHPKFNDVRSLHKVLWELGLDTSKPITERLCTHRNLQKEVVTCLMYRGEERTDKGWLQSGCASIEAVKKSTRDKSLQQELDRMRNKG